MWKKAIFGIFQVFFCTFWLSTNLAQIVGENAVGKYL